MNSFNLLSESWIKVINSENVEQDLSLIEIFEQAHDLRSVTDSNPLVVASIYRLLLVILYRSLQLSTDVEEWLDIYGSGRFPIEVTDYLKDHEDRFDLFSERWPFFQTADFKKDATTSIKKLSPDFATANNKTLFSHYSDGENFSLLPKDAAKYLLVCQYFSLGGGISGSSNLSKKHPNYTHAPLIGGALTYLTGDNLFKTLLFNLRPLESNDSSPNDCPVWENDELTGTGVREPMGALDYLTFKSRHVRFLPDEIGNVSEMYITQAYNLPAESLYREKEPAFAYRLNSKQEIRAVPVSFDRSFWRDSKSIYQRIQLGTNEKKDRRPACFRWIADLIDYGDICQQQVGCIVVGLENAKANPLSWLIEILPVNVKLLLESESTDYFVWAMESSDKIASRIDYALRTYAEYTLPPNSKEEDIKKEVKRIDKRVNYWSEVAAGYPDLVNNITIDEEKTFRSWLSMCIDAAEKNLDYALNNQLGRTMKELKARSLAQQKLNALLAPFRKELTNEE